MLPLLNNPVSLSCISNSLRYAIFRSLLYAGGNTFISNSIVIECLLWISYRVFLLYLRPTVHFLHVYLSYFTNTTSWLPY